MKKTARTMRGGMSIKPKSFNLILLIAPKTQKTVPMISAVQGCGFRFFAAKYVISPRTVGIKHSPKIKDMSPTNK